MLVGGIRAVFAYQQENKGPSSKDGSKGCFGAVPYTLGARIYKDISVRPDS